MHMADALVSATVGGGFWALSGGSLAGCSRRLRSEGNDAQVPLMGVLGAFVFAAQMVNFAIPGTGSSGHLGGGLLLAVLLGPSAAVLVMGSVLLMQALFFADGGLLAFGCNLFNMGILPAFVAYPLVYSPLARRGWLGAAAVLGALAALQLGALGVVLETVVSGLAGLPLKPFLLSMLAIHLPIGVVEGIVTMGLLRFVGKARPALLETPMESPGRTLLGVFLGFALLAGGLLSWTASDRPDGLAWSMASAARASSQVEPSAPSTGLHKFLRRLQLRTSVLPANALPKPGEGTPKGAGTSLSGLLGGALTLGLITCAGWLMARRRKHIPTPQARS
ncbi:MAG: energy-coupling factor ABC transporter permease [Acidobacteriota bacterium]|nr:energy-coupling factor ABC transporter permease [Acidobacteriota bacterium]